MAMLASGGASQDCMLLSIPDARTIGQERVMFMVTHGIRNDCDPGCFCAGAGYDIIDVIYPGADEATHLWAFTTEFNDQEMELTWGCDMCSTEAAAQLALAAGMGAADVFLIVIALTAAVQSPQGEAPRTTSDYEVFRRLMRLRIGRAAGEAAREAAREDSDYDEDDADDEDELRYDREHEEEAEYTYGTLQRGYTRRGGGGEVYVDPYADVQLPVYPGGYSQLSAELLPRTGLVVPKDRLSGLKGKNNIRKKALKWLLTIDRSSLLSVHIATKGWGERLSVDFFAIQNAAMEARWAAEEQGQDPPAEPQRTNPNTLLPGPGPTF